MIVKGRIDIKSAYQDQALADDYIKARFEDPFGAEFHRQQLERINRAIQRADPRSLLEIACGPARLTPSLRRVEQSVAVEQSPAMIARAVERLRRLGATHWRLIKGDGFEMPFRDASFDMVVTARFIRHFDRSDRQRLYAGVRRVLRPGGWLVFDVAHGPAYRWLLSKWGVAGSWVDDFWFERDEFVAEIRENGFAVESLDPVHSHVRVQHYLYSYAHPRLPRLARTLSRSITRVGSGNAYEWVAVCRRA
jgi:ubiquinone/menaquinone biosynthesis C-methylase UbiE